MQRSVSYHGNPVMEPGPLSDVRGHGNWRDYITLAKVGITLSNLLTTFTGLWLASQGYLDGTLTLFTLLGAALVIASGTYLNNYIDRDIDAEMRRTQHRPLPSGRVDHRWVLWTGIALFAAGMSVLTVFTTPLAAFWAFAGWFVYVFLYTLWLKRTSTLSTVIGSISGAAPPLIGWTAVTGTMSIGAWLLFIIMFLWQPPHFLSLGMQRVEDYRAAGIPLLPVVRGFEETKWQIARYVTALIPASLLLYGFHYVRWEYLASAVVLSLVYLVYAIRGFFVRDDILWSKKMFRFSIVYMTLLFLAMIATVQ